MSTTYGALKTRIATVLLDPSGKTFGATLLPELAIAGLVAPERRGAVLGTLLSGSTGGMLLARTFSGTLGEWLGWRAPYLVAAGLVMG